MDSCEVKAVIECDQTQDRESTHEKRKGNALSAIKTSFIKSRESLFYPAKLSSLISFPKKSIPSLSTYKYTLCVVPPALLHYFHMEKKEEKNGKQNYFFLCEMYYDSRAIRSLGSQL